ALKRGTGLTLQTTAFIVRIAAYANSTSCYSRAIRDTLGSFAPPHASGTLPRSCGNTEHTAGMCGHFNLQHGQQLPQLAQLPQPVQPYEPQQPPMLSTTTPTSALSTNHDNPSLSKHRRLSSYTQPILIPSNYRRLNSYTRPILIPSTTAASAQTYDPFSSPATTAVSAPNPDILIPSNNHRLTRVHPTRPQRLQPPHPSVTGIYLI
ncbi:unnamed protein product, partial [Allacma fusca]